MIKFFRHIRRSLINENRMGKYFKYAIGEIILVVIGILIALQINNWNEKRVEQNKVNNYYNRIYQELQLGLTSKRGSKESIVQLIKDHKRTLNILNSKNKDSLVNLSNTLGASATAWANNLTLPITEEFLNQGYLAKVQNDSLKSLFQNLTFLFRRGKYYDETIMNQYQNTIEPYIIKHINYTEIALPHYKKGLVLGGPETNFQSIFDDMELYNIITFKLELLNAQNSFLEGWISLLGEISSQLETEINL